MKIQLLCGVEEVIKHPLKPYSDIVCRFLDDFSGLLRKDREAKQYPDVQTFAFWIRKTSIQGKKKEFEQYRNNINRIGKGIAFHIAPSNVPVNCMFTYVFGLLAGNSNIVRIPTKQFGQIECMCRILNELFDKDEYECIKNMTSIVRYEHDKEVTDLYSKMCNTRVIWGGDATIEEIRKSPLMPRSTEITFADRYSFAVVDLQKWMNADDTEKDRLAAAFYNDTYLMDQNACSAPHLLCWKKMGNTTGSGNENNNELINDFWQRIYKAACRYELADIKVSEKYAMLCESVISNERISNVSTKDNLLYVCRLSSIAEDVTTVCRGRYGLFFECIIDSYEELKVLDNEKVQTCVYYGDESAKLADYFAEAGFCGVDRIVAFGKTLDIDVVWDGYDIIAHMSRIIERCD